MARAGAPPVYQRRLSKVAKNRRAAGLATAPPEAAWDRRVAGPATAPPENDQSKRAAGLSKVTRTGARPVRPRRPRGCPARGRSSHGTSRGRAEASWPRAAHLATTSAEAPGQARGQALPLRTPRPTPGSPAMAPAAVSSPRAVKARECPGGASRSRVAAVELASVLSALSGDGARREWPGQASARPQVRGRAFYSRGAFQTQ